MTMHDDHDHNHDNPWADRVNEAYYDAMGVEFGRKTRDRINWMCAQARGDTVLDVGCSQGIASILMAREGMCVTGLDIYPPAIEYAMSERAKEVESVQQRLDFRCGELAAIGDEQFDTVVMGEVVEHQANPNRFIRQGAARVAPGGRLIVTVPFGLNPWPDHKSTVFPRQLHEAVADEFEMVSIEVIDGYARLVADRRPAGEPVRNDLLALLQETEKGALDSQVSYYAASAMCQEHAKAKVSLEVAAKSYRDQIGKLNVRIAELERDIAVARERATGLDAEVEITRQSVADLGAAHEMLRVMREADHAEQIALINTSRTELAELHKAQVELAQTNARRLEDMLAASAQLHEQVAALQADLEKAQNHERAAIERERSDQAELAALREAEAARTRAISELEARLKKLTAKLKEVQEDRSAHWVKLEAERSQVAALRAELAKAQHDGRAAIERARSQQAELDALRETNAAHARTASELEARLKKLAAELEEAQGKRSAHWAKLEAQRARAQQLIELAQRLHEENQRYENSIALAIGRALLGLRSAKGILGFPRAMARVVRQVQRRRNGTVPFVQLQLPALKSVVVAQLGKKAATPTATVAQATEETARRRAEDQEKNLSVIGWGEPEARGAILVMSVLDEFSRACFAPHANLIEARPDNWEGLLEKFSPRFLIAESAWSGNRGTWRYRVASAEHPPGDEFAQMTAGFRKRGLPTIFWSKEDPVHFDAFVQAAGRCDLILTTSAESVERYRDQTRARIEVMQFAAEDSLHNPQGSSQRNGKVCFAGSYYAEGFDERRGGQTMLLEVAKGFGLEIYDRNQRDVGAHSEFGFPKEYAPHIRGRLDFEILSRKYREYQVFLNVNSVSDSTTMFSRRVFELLACGTPVVSTYSRGIEQTFGNDIVWQVRDQAEAAEALRVLTTDSKEWRRRSLAGIRAVLSRHTYRHRFSQILSLVGERTPDPAQVVAIAEVASQTDADLALDMFLCQEVGEDVRKQLLLVCRKGFHLDNAPISARVLPDTDVPLTQVVDWESESTPGAIVAVFSPLAVYGRHYLLDAVIALRYSRACVVGKAVGGAEYEWGRELDPRSLVIDTQALATANRKPVDVLDARGEVAPAFASKAYAADSANFAVAVEAGTARELLLQMIEV